MNGFEIDICIAFTVWAISLGLFFPLYTTTLSSPMDEGFHLCPAQRVKTGEFPYKDFFIGTGTKGKAYITALFFHLFGENIRSARIYWAISATLFPPLLYTISRQIGISSHFSIFSPFLFWIFMLPPRKFFPPIFLSTGMGSDRMLFGLIFLIWGMAFPMEEKIYWVVWGMLLGLTWIWGQEIAFFSFCGMIGLKGMEILNFFFPFGIGFSIIIVSYIFYFLVHGVRLKDLVYQNIIILFEFKRRQCTRLPYPSLFKNIQRIPCSARDPFWRDGLMSIVFKGNFYLPFLLISGGIFMLVLQGLTFGPLMGLIFFCISSLMIIRERADYFHMVHALIPCLVLAGLIGENLVLKFLSKSGTFSFVLFYILLITGYWLAYHLYQAARTLLMEFFNPAGRMMLSVKRGKVRVEEAYGKSAQEMVDWLHKNTRPEERIVVIPHDPLIYFLSNRRPPGKIFAIFAYWDEKELAEVVSDMKRAEVRYVIKNRDWFNNALDNNAHFSTYGGPLDQYIQGHYKTFLSFGMHEVMMKVEEGSV